jgi:hypothetical protein
MELVFGELDNTLTMVALLHSQHARFNPFNGLLFPMYVDGHFDSIMS